MAASSAAKDAQDSGLLQLPAELRNTIYEYVLHSEGPVALDEYDGCSKSRRKSIEFSALLQVCGQVRDEAAGIWYSSSVFLWFDIEILIGFTALIEPKRLRQVGTLRDELQWVSREKCEEELGRVQSELQAHGTSIRDGVLESTYEDLDTPDTSAPVRL